MAWGAAALSALGLYLLSGSGAEFTARGDGLVLLCALAFAAHILATGRAVERHDVGALLAVQLGACGLARRARSPATSRRPPTAPSGPRCC